MAYKLTLQDAQGELALLKSSGVSPTSPDFSDYLNRAQRILLRRGNWFDTEWIISLCVSGSIIAWPRCVGTVIGVRFGHGKAGQLFNNNFSFVGPHHRFGNFHCDAIIEDINSSPTANPISGTSGKKIRYYVMKATDVGKTITMFGSQYGGQPLQETVNTAWKNGVTLNASIPYVESPMLVTRIDSITRQATDGMSYLYEFDPVANTLRDLAVFEPGDTNPRIRRSIIKNKPYNCSTPDANGICWTNIEALIKLEFIPAVNPWDFLMIDNIEALTFMVRSIKEGEAGDKQSQEASILQAVREMNFELRDKNPDAQTAVRVNSVVGRKIRNPT